MVVAAALGLAAGILLAQYFRALILVPMTVLALAATAFSETINGQSPLRTILTSLFVALALQLGFVCWVFLKGFIQASQANEPFSAISEGAERALRGEFGPGQL
jgi:hypothetical protein